MQGKYSAECLHSNIKRKYKALNAVQSLSRRAARRRLLLTADAPSKTCKDNLERCPSPRKMTCQGEPGGKPGSSVTWLRSTMDLTWGGCSSRCRSLCAGILAAAGFWWARLLPSWDGGYQITCFDVGFLPGRGRKADLCLSPHPQPAPCFAFPSGRSLCRGDGCHGPSPPRAANGGKRRQRTGMLVGSVQAA